MKRETFTNAIESIKKQHEIDNENAELLGKVFSNAFSANLLYDNSTISDAIIKLLETEMQDRHEWINYFCYELDFGRENERLKVYDSEDNEIPLKTADDLYNMLANDKKNKFKVITLCGSTKFKEEFLDAQKKLTLEGNIVISVGLFGHAGDSEALSENTKTMLDDIHKSKIDMADEIFVINVDGYIGESTKSEIVYAKTTGKKVNYLIEHE